MTAKIPAPPAGTKSEGRRLWRAVLTEFELREDEMVLLRSACLTADLVADLQAVVAKEGPLRDGKAHPAAVEARQQRLVLARLLAALRLPEDQADDRRAQRRVGVRGVYKLRAISGGAS